jgi:hypothetical protein
MVKNYNPIHRKKSLACAFLLGILSQFLTAQDSSQYLRGYLSVGFLQIKESANYGLIFRGPSIDGGFSWTYPHRRNARFYELKFMAAAPIAKGIVGLNASFKPIELAYAWKIPVNKFALKIGPTLKMEYNLQFYPDIQSGYYFWLTNYCGGLSIFASFKIKSSILRIRAFNNIYGVVSRGEVYEDPYFYDSKFSDIVEDIHSDFTPVAPGQFNNTFFEIGYRKSAVSRLTISYVFDYFVYFDDPKIKFLNQSLRLTFNPRNNEN